MYAIIADGGRQYRVEEGQEVELDYREVPPGEQLTFDRVLALSAEDGLKLGQPNVAGATVTAEVVVPAIVVPSAVAVKLPPSVTDMVFDVVAALVFVAPVIAVPAAAVETLPPPDMDIEEPAAVVPSEPPPAVLMVLDVVLVSVLVAPVIVLAEVPTLPTVLIELTVVAPILLACPSMLFEPLAALTVM